VHLNPCNRTRQAAEDAVAAARAAAARVTAAHSEAAASTAAERFAQRERVAAAAARAEAAAHAARSALHAAHAHAQERRAAKAARQAAAAAARGVKSSTANGDCSGDTAPLSRAFEEEGSANAAEEEESGGGDDDAAWDEDALEASLELSASDAAADGLVRPSTRAEEHVLGKLDPRVWTERWDAVAALLAELPTRQQRGVAGAGTADASGGGGSDAPQGLAVASPPSFLRKRKTALDASPGLPQHDRRHDGANSGKSRGKGGSGSPANLGASGSSVHGSDGSSVLALSYAGLAAGDAEERGGRELAWVEACLADADQVTALLLLSPWFWMRLKIIIEKQIYSF
jgi:hypothetical protein